MRYIKFATVRFPLIGDNLTGTKFQATISADNSTLDEIYNQIAQSEEIKIYEDDDAIAVYTGYTKLCAMIVHSTDNVSIELDNIDVLNLIDSLTDSVSTLTKSVETNSEEISALNDSQESQDEIISDILEAM